MRQADFHIKAENKPAALDALHKMWTPEAMKANSPRGGTWGANGPAAIWYSWMNDTSLSRGECPSFEEGMAEWGYPVDVDDAGNIAFINFHGEKMGDETHMFKAIAPYVEDGSFIEMEGEDGSLWRWVFRDGEVIEVEPVIVWPS